MMALRALLSLLAGAPLAAVVLSATAVRADTSATWTLLATSRPGYVSLTLERKATTATGHSSFSWNEDILRPDLAAHLAGPAHAIDFTFVRDGGTLTAHGNAGDGRGIGEWTFAPSEAFGKALDARGIARPSANESLRLALAGVGIAYVDALPRNPRPSIDAIVRAADHDVTPEYLRHVAADGYGSATLDTIIRMRDHDVDLAFIGGLRAAGYTHLDGDDVIRLTDHDVKLAFITGLASRGYKALAAEDLIRLVDHGVTLGYIDRLRAHGYGNLLIPDIIRLSDRGV